MAHTAWVTTTHDGGRHLLDSESPNHRVGIRCEGFSHGLQELRTKTRSLNTNQLSYVSLMRAM